MLNLLLHHGEVGGVNLVAEHVAQHLRADRVVGSLPVLLDDGVAEQSRDARDFLHPVGQDDTPWLAGHNLAWLAGAPFEDTAVALRLILAGVTDRYPRIR